MITVPTTAQFDINREKACPDGQAPCVVCGNPTRMDKAKTLHLHNGGWTAVTEAEAQTLDPAGDMGEWPIGPDCLRAHPELLPYILD